MTDATALYGLIEQGEHQEQDFKYEISSISKIARSLSAFANTDGGRLLVGVKDNGKIAGVRTDEEYYMIEAAASNYCTPEAEVLMEVVRAEGKCVLVATVARAGKRPVFAREEDGTRRAYVRIHDENIVATPVHLSVWRAENSGSGTLMAFTEREQRLLNVLAEGEGMSLNRFCRLSGLERRKAVALLAHFVRFGLVEIRFSNHRFYFRAVM